MNCKSIYLCVAMMLAAGGTLSAQSVQKGQVLLYHGKEAKTPLQGVSVSAQGASATVSDAEGNFVLNFRTLHAGDAINFRRIELNGYEVMNSEALEVARVSTLNAEGDNSAPLVIVMASVEELAKLRDGYRTVAAERYQKQYAESQRQLEQLKQEGKIKMDEYNERLEALSVTLESQLENLDNYVDKFARIDLSDLDEFEQQIIALVQEGKFEEAIGKYEEQNLTARLQQTVQEQRQLNQDVKTVENSIDAKKAEQERLKENIDKQIELLQKVGGEENMHKIEELRKVKK